MRGHYSKEIDPAILEETMVLIRLIQNLTKKKYLNNFTDTLLDMMILI